jgi:guanylate kinase
VHYQFIAQRQFERMRDGDDLLEWAEVHANFYGTPREPVEKALAAGKDVLFDIDWQGTQQLYKRMRDDVVSVFVLPPSAAELKKRLEHRAEDSTEVIARRLRNAAEEIPHWTEYDYVLVNRDLDKSFARLRAILTAERLKRVLRPKLETFVGELLTDLKGMQP